MNLDFPEMLFIFVLALLLFGPKKLPQIARQIGKALAEFKRASNEIQWRIREEMGILEQSADLPHLSRLVSRLFRLEKDQTLVRFQMGDSVRLD